MLQHFFISVIFLLLLTASCSDNDNYLGLADPDLINCWTHSYEEETTDSIHVYRPCDFMQFPASLYRDMFELRADGSADFLVLSPVDAHYLDHGCWTYEPATDHVTIRDQDHHVVRSFDVLSVTPDQLLLRN